jgi:hypothetical protein
MLGNCTASMTTSTAPEVVDLRGRVASNLRATSLVGPPAVTVAAAISALVSVPPRSRRASSTRESWPGLPGCEHGDGGHPAGLLLVATSPGACARMTSCHNMSRSVLSATRTSASRCVAPICICAWVAAVRLRNHCGSRVGPLPEPATSTIVSTPPGPPRCRSGLDHRDQPEPIQSQRPFPPARCRRLHQGPRCFSMCSHARRSRTLTHVVMDRQLQITYRSLSSTAEFCHHGQSKWL